MQPSHAFRRRAGFSFIEILVVMGIIALLAGLGVVVVQIAARRGPESNTRTLVLNLKGYVDAWKQAFKEYPPMQLSEIGKRAESSKEIKAAEVTNHTNEPIEALYQALHWPGFAADVQFSEEQTSNLDDDQLRTAPTSRGPALLELRDAYGNPLYYFVNTMYAKSEQAPPTYDNVRHGEVQPKPWREPGGGFVNPNGFQIFSAGEDGLPNTDDDIKSW